MAVISAAVAAVSIAIAAPAVATVTAAVVATSIAIGTIGLAVTAVGMVTGNKDLLKAGKIMGYVGLAGGLAGTAIGMSAGAEAFGQAMNEAYSKGASEGLLSMLQPTDTAQVVTQEGLGRGIVASQGVITPPTTPIPAGYEGLAQEAVGKGIATGTSVNQIAAPQALAAAATPPAPLTGIGPTGPTAPSMPIGSAGAPPPAPGAPVSPVAPAGPAITAPNAPVAPTGLSEFAKLQLALTGGQAAAGLAGGWFQGQSAEERLNLDKQINEQNQAQRELVNRNNAYAPTLQFQKPGLIAQARR